MCSTIVYKLISIQSWLFHHISITLVLTWVLKNDMVSTTPSNCHGNVMDRVLIFSSWWLFHHISITMVSNCHKNVMEMWCQEKNNMQIEISIFQNNPFYSSQPPPVRIEIIILTNFTCFYKIFTIKMKDFVDSVYLQYLKILLNMVTPLVCYCSLVTVYDWSKNAMDHSMAIENGSSILS